MKLTDKELKQIIKEEFELEQKRRAITKQLAEINAKLSSLNESSNIPTGYSDPADNNSTSPSLGGDSNMPTGYPDPAAEEHVDLIVSEYEFTNGNSDITVYFQGFDPVVVDGDNFVDMYEQKVGKKFPAIMAVDEVLMSFKNTKQDISEYLIDYVDNYLSLIHI